VSKCRLGPCLSQNALSDCQTQHLGSAVYASDTPFDDMQPLTAREPKGQMQPCFHSAMPPLVAVRQQSLRSSRTQCGGKRVVVGSQL